MLRLDNKTIWLLYTQDADYFIFYLTIFILFPCQSQEEECETVNSVEYGKLFLKKSEKLSSSCISNWVFESKETGKKFCLGKNAKKGTNLLAMVAYLDKKTNQVSHLWQLSHVCFEIKPNVIIVNP